MEMERAKELLAVLADGVNPITGEVLAEGDSCNQVEIVRALNTVLRFIESRPQKSGKQLPENAGKPWTKEDEAVLCRMFEAGCSRKELCAHFKRSPGAIASRLVKVGKMGEREEF